MAAMENRQILCCQRRGCEEDYCRLEGQVKAFANFSVERIAAGRVRLAPSSTFPERHRPPHHWLSHRMKVLSFLPVLLVAAFCSGCAAQRDPLQSPGRVTYYDRNADGKVDQERHHYPGVADADWELRDDDFDGRYEKKILYGVSISESHVDIPVPTNVHISKQR